MWENVVYTKAQAKYKFQEIEAEPENCAPRQVKPPFDQLREYIINEKKSFLMNDKMKINSYAFDLHMGLVLYSLLNDSYRFNERLAAQDEIWRYLSLEVFPDLVYERFGINDQRFYKGTRRIWLKSIWWYIHLSWQGTEEETLNTLRDNSSDHILQLLDRSGSGGYRAELTRELMRQYKLYSSSKVPELFRRILKLNTARLNMIEPSLVEGGIKTYVDDLFKYFMNDA
ncbi:hypothetical protein [Cytobacillus oceanisediminis]|uniref:Uncharacterized protein n=1 Tax=Cytobacillus oceanisediminis TaxID=665099 RepID=A0ABX3D061_9BACI|nr:hypothetical protein [Cytobacillus oceanisediminis]OHX50693.1 hypothetical protein BBV17_06640 [Cytobacillus oceanisediminis]